MMAERAVLLAAWGAGKIEPKLGAPGWIGAAQPRIRGANERYRRHSEGRRDVPRPAVT